jgi:ligand-binding SRPBCC domain-containing protein
MARHKLIQEQIIPANRQKVFDFFSRAENLEKLTPSFLEFRITTSGAIEMQVGTRIDYVIRLQGIPMKWRTRIDAFEPNQFFTDTQLKGPYRFWQHRHDFEDCADGTKMTDTVHYELPFGLLGSLVHQIYVRRQLQVIFAYRRTAVGDIFGR